MFFLCSALVILVLYATTPTICKKWKFGWKHTVRRIWYEFRFRLLLLRKQYLRAGKLIYEKFPSDRKRAIRVFTKAAKQGRKRPGDVDDAIEAMVPLGHLFEAADEPHYAVMVYDAMENRSRDTNPYMNAYANERLELLNVVRPPNPNVHLNVYSNVNLNAPNNVPIPTLPKPRPVKVTSDPQNVHDSGTVKTMAQSYKAIKTLDSIGTSSSSSSETLRDIRKRCEDYTKTDEGKMKKALKALDTMEMSTTPVTSLGCEKEVDVLCSVWRRITNCHEDSVKDVLVDQLVDCVDDDGRVICTGGRVGRVIDTLTAIDPLVTIKPRWAHRREILDLASKLRGEIEDSGEFERVLREECKKRYVETDLMPSKMLDAELDSWIHTL